MNLQFYINNTPATQLIAEANYGTVKVLERIEEANDMFKAHPKEVELCWRDGMKIVKEN